MVQREEKKFLFGKTGKALQKEVFAKKAEVKRWSATFLREKLRRLQLDGKGRLEASRLEFELGGGSVPAVYWASGSDEMQSGGRVQPPFPSERRFDHAVTGGKVKRTGIASALKRLATRAEMRRLFGIAITTAKQQDAFETLESLNPRRRKRYARSGILQGDRKRGRELQAQEGKDERRERIAKEVGSKAAEYWASLARWEAIRQKRKEEEAERRRPFIPKRKKMIVEEDPVLVAKKEELKIERRELVATHVERSKREGFGKEKSKPVGFNDLAESSDIGRLLSTRVEVLAEQGIGQESGRLARGKLGALVGKKALAQDYQLTPSTPLPSTSRASVVFACAACRSGTVKDHALDCKCRGNCGRDNCPK